MSDDIPKTHSESYSLARRSSQQMHRPRSGARQAQLAPISALHNGAGVVLTPAFLWWTFLQWWMVVIPVGILLAGLVAFIVVITYRPDYRASALIMIEDTAPYIAFNNEANSGATQKYVETQIELLRSALVLEPVLSIPDIAKKPDILAAADKLAHLQQHLTISRVGGAELYTVSYTCKIPQDAADVANAVIKEYLKMQSNDEFERFQRVIVLLEEERNRREIDIERRRKRVLELAEQVTGRDPFNQNVTLNFERANSPSFGTYQQLTTIEVNRALLQAQLAALSDPLLYDENDPKQAQVVEMEVDDDPRIAMSELEIADLTLRAEKQKLLKNKWEEDPTFQQLQAEIEKRKESLSELRRSVRDELYLKRKEGRQAKRTDEISEIKHSLAQLEAQRDLLRERFEEETKSLKKGNTKAVEFEFARAELVREEKVFEMIAARKLAMQTESRKPARVTPRQKAQVPLRPVSPLPYSYLLMFCTAAMMAPFGLAVVREQLVRRVGDAVQLSRETALHVLGEISHFPIRRAASNPQALPGKLRRQMFLYLDSIDSLRTNIALSEHGRELQVLVVTSAAAGEGKTCLSTSLALSIARADNRPVLVIDADLRSPDVANVLSLKDKPGLAELLRNDAALGNVVQRVGETNAYVITAGRLKGNPHCLIKEEALRPLIEKLRSKFATIIIDTPPVFGGSESLVLAKVADATILSVMCNQSRSRRLQGAVERLERSGANLLGAVLNGQSAFSYAYSYGYGDYSGRLDITGA